MNFHTGQCLTDFTRRSAPANAVGAYMLCAAAKRIVVPGRSSHAFLKSRGSVDSFHSIYLDDSRVRRSFAPLFSAGNGVADAAGVAGPGTEQSQREVVADGVDAL